MTAENESKKFIRRSTRGVILEYAFIIIFCLFSVFPFYWMLVGATNQSADVVTGKLTFGTYLFENIKTMIKTLNVGRAFWNSLRTTLIQTVLSIMVCSMAGYGFQIYRDKGKDRLMKILLLSMMIPFATTMVPLFKMFSKIHLLNTTLGFVLPSISTAFLIFFFRQNSMSFPIETIQAARVDGLSEFMIYCRVYLPIMKPTFAAAAIVTFMNGWNNYLWPLIVMQSQKMQTMPLLVTGLTSGYVTDYGLLMLCVTIMTLPTVLIFFTQQKRFVEGIIGSVK
ncbi:MAG: carbohydrate ABC transporter permease [Spirochaetaceae bacterium]|nr:carbohydrate ABC transporter permease [Spirochaetaceae bacterium]MBQ4553573.1 carbohydrate ABC transporter permease [Spirochaetaceae bacterium]MBQ8353097.1 carbohydrate ABC transporter permease [Spirochaetaceae bacterium]MBR4012385.1 carbohydrate ABC transporter permease [Spirochaetaceae bacterium]